MRRKLVVANWKMNLNLAQSRELVAALKAGHPPDSPVELAVCPAFPYLFPMAKALDGSGIALGAQNVFHETAGAFTGEVSPQMLRDTGARLVIIGHSERRNVIGHLEDDRMVNLKLRALLAAGLTPILCVGETIEQRKAGRTDDVIGFQLAAALLDAVLPGPAALVLAYEPVWAIGTGLNATPDQAQQAHAFLRARLEKLVGVELARGVRILYGGSVKPDNARDLFSCPDVDGGLIGGASLQADQFLAIARAALPR